MPHGGPHSCYPASYFSGYTFLVSLGYNLVLVNFRGSTGFGEDSIQSLPGNIATNDVLDCMACLQAAIDTGIGLHCLFTCLLLYAPSYAFSSTGPYSSCRLTCKVSKCKQVQTDRQMGAPIELCHAADTACSGPRLLVKRSWLQTCIHIKIAKTVARFLTPVSIYIVLRRAGR